MPLNEKQIEAIADHAIAALKHAVTEPGHTYKGKAAVKLSVSEITENLATLSMRDGAGLWSIRYAMESIRYKIAMKLGVVITDVDWDTDGASLTKSFLFNAPATSLLPPIADFDDDESLAKRLLAEAAQREAAAVQRENAFRQALGDLCNAAKFVQDTPDVFVLHREDVQKAMAFLMNNPVIVTG